VAELKLARLPERTPVKLIIHVSPDLNRALEDYAALYEEAYGAREEVTELVPAMLSAFLEGDRGFARRRGKGGA
jgi:hypothetical protein